TPEHLARSSSGEFTSTCGGRPPTYVLMLSSGPRHGSRAREPSLRPGLTQAALPGPARPLRFYLHRQASEVDTPAYRLGPVAAGDRFVKSAVVKLPAVTLTVFSRLVF